MRLKLINSTEKNMKALKQLKNKEKKNKQDHTPKNTEKRMVLT